MIKVPKALIVAPPWIDLILDGQKTWEMRSTRTAHRGWFGLIRKGSGTICGVARLVNVGEPLSQDQLLASIDEHRIPREMILSGEIGNWTIPWHLSDVTPLEQPVPYVHKAGAMTWVVLDPSAVREVGRQLSSAHHPAQPSRNRPPATTGGIPLGQAVLTEGNIRNGHFYLTSMLHLLPADAVGGRNRAEQAARIVVVERPDGESVETDIDGTKRIFRARGWIRSWFAETGAAAGDSVLLYEVGPYRYRAELRKAEASPSPATGQAA